MRILLALDAILILAMVCFLVFFVIPNFLACGDHEAQKAKLLAELDQAESLRYQEAEGMVAVSLRLAKGRRELYSFPLGVFNRDALASSGFRPGGTENGWEVWINTKEQSKGD